MIIKKRIVKAKMCNFLLKILIKVLKLHFNYITYVNFELFLTSEKTLKIFKYHLESIFKRIFIDIKNNSL